MHGSDHDQDSQTSYDDDEEEEEENKQQMPRARYSRCYNFSAFEKN